MFKNAHYIMIEDKEILKMVKNVKINLYGKKNISFLLRQLTCLNYNYHARLNFMIS